MLRIAQFIAALFVIVFSVAAGAAIFFPDAVGAASGFNPTSDYGITNIRTLGAPLLMMAVVTAIGAYTRQWILLFPATIYFLFNGLTRVLSLFNEQYDDVMLRGLFLTFGLFTLAIFVLKTFRRAEKQPAIG
ncbi:hypothetical protein SG34_002575 [Thalassomonas viridans]|uniref:DUF4345 domain-containing protein n=1 Tax=Thalassomonas viridans TaxID=137584 RepID=A0AAE9Z3E9_9GAMM|nr:hypothetical protein [Thalassomonas viridans]WDE05838.1 hypothetical protein SG34_002575 [Thalassomonas viridans]